jgi:hypothetical protein
MDLNGQTYTPVSIYVTGRKLIFAAEYNVWWVKQPVS